MITFKRIDANNIPWDKLSDFDGANIFHTLPWINFIADAKKAEPIIAAIQSDNQVQGYFMGFITEKYGFRILGSPFRGWCTYFMGFILLPGVSYHDVLQAFPRFAFDELKCHYIEIVDENLKKDEWQGLSYQVEKLHWFALDLTQSEEELLANMTPKSVRKHIRRAIRKGIVIEETTDPGFADEYYAQYQEILAKKSLEPAYSLDFVHQMIKHLLPTGNLLLLRARTAEGVCIATDISLIFNKVAVGWGGASLPQYQVLNPNELIYWYGMKRLKAMGAEVLHLGGEAVEFKKKFGSYEAQIFRLMKPRYAFLNIPLHIVTSLKNPRVRNWILKEIGR
jgi:CelD/BcsL family acetyltransferase involved in cellulose biosynthesis